jgi:hypothetical protein
MSANMKNIMTMITNTNNDSIIDALDKFCEMINDFDNIDEIIAQKEIFKATFKVTALKATKGTKRNIIDGVEKKKRAPSMFNLYVKWIMPSLKEVDASGAVKSNELMSLAADKWKNNADPFGVFVKEHTKTFKKCFPNLEASELFQKMRTSFEEGGVVPVAGAIEEITSNTETDSEPEPAKKKTVAKKSVKKTAQVE